MGILFEGRLREKTNKVRRLLSKRGIEVSDAILGAKLGRRKTGAHGPPLLIHLTPENRNALNELSRDLETRDHQAAISAFFVRHVKLTPVDVTRFRIQFYSRPGSKKLCFAVAARF